MWGLQERSIADYFVLIKTQTEIRLQDLNVNAKTLLQLSHIAIFSLVFPSTKKCFVKRKKLSIWKRPFFSACIKLLLLIWVESLLLSFSGNVAINLDLRCNIDAPFSISPWNSNSIVVRNCVKSLLKTCISIYSLGITHPFLKLTMT